MSGYYSKKLQKSSKLYKELQENIKFYVEYSIEKEHKQNSYLKAHKFINSSTGEVLEKSYEFEKSYKEYSKIVEQRALTIQELSKRNENMCSVFCTLTLPSNYHPFRSITTPKGRLYVEENPEFAFDTLKEAVTGGYKELNRIYQTFYKRLKNYVKSDLYYIKSIESHQSTVPHLHLVLYFPFDNLDEVKGVFKRVVEYFNLDRTDFEEVSFQENINYASKYLLKYITKDLNNSSDIYKARVLDGWKKFHKIRTLTSSQLPLNVMVYKNIYKAISFMDKSKFNSNCDDKISKVKKEIDKEIKSSNIPLYLYFQDNFSIQKTILSGDNRKVINYGKREALIKVKLTTEKKAKYYKIKRFEVSYKNEKIYTKQRYTKIQI